MYFITVEPPRLIASYEYDPWGKVTSVKGSSGAILSLEAYPNHIAHVNPIRYRGYYYDIETGFYYLQSRYYDPAISRFINADSYGSTGQGFLGTNMFAYCLNNPVNLTDPSGHFGVAAAIIASAIVAIALSGCSAKTEQKPEPYKSADEAAKAFSEETYSSSLYIRHEYATEIYSRTINGETTYNYNAPHAGSPHSVTLGTSIPSGTRLVAYAHTHPNSNKFSGLEAGATKGDIPVAKSLGVNAYVVGPDLLLQRYNVTTNTVDEIGSISPIILTDAQQAALVSEFQASWNAHITKECGFGCRSKVWPTP